jgi:NADH:ubiquinone oxidoreductase subunit E
MLITERDRLRDDVTAIAERTAFHRSSLIPILQEVKGKYRGIDSYAMQLIADVLDIHPVEVFAVATFYAFLDPEAEGTQVFRLCRTLSCEFSGKDQVARQLQQELGLNFGETSADGRFSLEWTNCMGMCDQGPAMLVNDRVYTKLTAAKVHEILQEHLSNADGVGSGTIAERVR